MTTTTDATTPTMRKLQLPAHPQVPKTVQGVVALVNRTKALTLLRRRYGPDFTVNVPIFGRLVVLSDPDHIRELFRAGADSPTRSTQASAGSWAPIRCSR